ncbi:MAG: type VI secretion system-associated protein TagF [Planctomycetota bacterium]
MTGTTITCLGKLPVHGDFVRLNQGQVPEIVEFDRWLLEGMERAYGARGRGFEAELRALPPLRFLYTSRQSGRVLDGLVLPSADQVGRAYPFVAGFAIGAIAPGPGYDRLPLLAMPSFTALGDLVATGGSSGQLAPFLEQLLTIAYAADDNAGEQALRSFLFGTTLDALCADWPQGHVPEHLKACLLDLRQMCQPPFPPRYLTAIPSRGAPAEACFWLTLVRQWLCARTNPTLVAWPANQGRGPVRLLYDDLHARYFEAVFWPERSTQLLDLGRATHRPPPLHQRDGGTAGSARPRVLLQDVILGAARG